MSSPCFEVSVNGKLVCKAKIKSANGVLSTNLTWVKRKGEKKGLSALMVSALDSDKDIHLEWCNKDGYMINDDISIRITNNMISDKPRNVKPMIKGKELIEMKLKSYYRLQKELKLYL